MEEIIIFIQSNIDIAPWLIFFVLLLAGLNLPVSEDAMLFISAILAAKNPDMLYSLFFAVYMGAFFSDIICYWLGRTLGPRLWKIQFFAKMVSPERVDQMGQYYKKYGIITLVVGRFIPFGVRNALFLTAGLSKMNFAKFAFSDFLACSISSLAFFSLYYTYGEKVVEYVKQGNMIIFSILLIVLGAILLKKSWAKKKHTSS